VNNTDSIFSELASLAIRVEGKGQYNVAKFIRAAQDSLLRAAAFRLGYDTDEAGVLAEFARVILRLEQEGCDPALLERLRQGYRKMEANELCTIGDFPPVSVCRRCGTVGGAFGVCPKCGSDIDSFVVHRPIYWMKEFDPMEAMHHLMKTPLKYINRVGALSADEAEKKPTPDQWSVLEVLKHIKDAEVVLNGRVKRILTEEHPYLSFQKVWDWADKPVEKKEMVGDVLAIYKQSRAETIRLLEEAQLKSWWRTAVHEEFGEVALLEQVSYFTAHEISHLRQIGGHY
jgi:hypothetical protein